MLQLSYYTIFLLPQLTFLAVYLLTEQIQRSRERREKEDTIFQGGICVRSARVLSNSLATRLPRHLILHLISPLGGVFASVLSFSMVVDLRNDAASKASSVRLLIGKPAAVADACLGCRVAENASASGRT